MGIWNTLAARLWLGLAALAALAAAATLALAPAAADGHLANLNKLPDDIELILGIEGDTDLIVQADSEFTVTAALRYSVPRFSEPFDPYRRWVIPAATVGPSNLRMGGPLDWETGTSHRLTIAPQNLVGFVPLHVPTGNPRAFDERTIVALGGDAGGIATLYIYDAWSKKRVAAVTKPDSAMNNYFGLGSPTLSHGFSSNSVGVWHETDSLAWLFVSSPTDTVAGRANVGRVYIYRLDWSDDTLEEVTLVTTMEPPKSEFDNEWGTTNPIYYSTSMTLSRDGSTLAVTAERMNVMGAVYVYTRPDGPGQNWGDIRYEDGVKVTPVAIPSHGTSEADNAFTPTSMGRTGAHTDCDEYCSRAFSLIQGGTKELGVRYTALSADGRVLTTSASEKRFPFETPGGPTTFQGSSPHFRNDKGEAYVWVAPEGGWNAAPRADMDEDGNPKTLIPAKTDARAFNPETHYSPGPLRRITEPTAILVSRLWTETGNYGNWFSEGLGLSPDGTTVVADASNRWAFIFQRPSVESWRELDGGYMLPTATLTDAATGSTVQGNMQFSGDGSELAIANAVGTSAAPANTLYVFRRPADGIWKDISASDPSVEKRSGVRYVLKDGHDGSRVVFGHWQNAYASDGGCTSEVEDGIETVTCPIPLTNAKVIVPEGTADGIVTLAGQVTLQQEGVEDSEVTLESEELVIQIRDLTEVAEARLSLAENGQGTTSTSDDRPYPSAIARGEETRLQLQILNENEMPSATGSVASVVLATTRGALTSRVENGDCAGGSGRKDCRIPVAALTGANSDNLLIELAHTGQTGAATVWATVLSDEGETISSNRVTVNLTGPPASLAIEAPAAGVLNVNAEVSEGAEASGADTDRRDELTLSVTAADEAGFKVALPAGRPPAFVYDSDGKIVSSGISIEWPLGGDLPTLDAAGDQQVRINIDRAAANPLPNGEYTIRLRAGSLSAEQTFSVSGLPATLTLSGAEGTPALQQELTLTATIADASGEAVPDGTAVRWSETPVGTGVNLIQRSVERATSGGRASATYLVVAPGSTTVQATAGENDMASDVRLISIASTAPPPRARLADSLVSPNTLGGNAWVGRAPVRASALAAELPGQNVISVWQAGRWHRYSESGDGESTDFQIWPSSVLWFSR